MKQHISKARQCLNCGHWENWHDVRLNDGRCDWGGCDCARLSLEKEINMTQNQPDPLDFLQRVFGELFDQRPAASRTARNEPSADQQRENLAFALAERAVTALEDLALNTAAIRQRLEKNATAKESAPNIIKPYGAQPTT